VAAGVEVTVTYTDASAATEKTASSTATDTPDLEPVYPDVSFTEFLVPEISYDGLKELLKITITNDADSPLAATGTVLVTGSDGSEFSALYADLKVDGSKHFSFTWESALTDPAVAELIEWTATLRAAGSDDESAIVDDAFAFTTLEVKTFGKRTYSDKLPSGAIGTLSFTTEDETCEFHSPPQFLPEAVVSPPSPTAIELPEGVVKFDADSCNPGATVVVTMDYGVIIPAGSTFWKLNSTEWREITGATINGSIVTYSITDGGENDEDGKVNGRFVDPAGVAIPAGSGIWPGAGAALLIPVNNPLTLLFMALGVALMAVRAQYRMGSGSRST